MKNSKTNKLVHSNSFNIVVIFVIILNSILIGVQLEFPSPLLDTIQQACLTFFIFEIVLRWLGRNSTKAYFKNPWNYFDIAIVIISLIPESMFEGASSLSAIRTLRILRAFRLFRLFKAFPDLQIMTKVLIKGIVSLSSVALLLGVFMYIFAVAGVILFKGEITVTSAYNEVTDPFGNIGEACFSLFRVATGDDWTELRYNLILSGVTPSVVSLYFIVWHILSAFLLMNIVFGAIISHFESITRGDENDKTEKIIKKLEAIEKKLDG